MNEQKIQLPIEGMHCASCARNIEKSLAKTTGVIDANVNYATETATVRYDENAIKEADLHNVIKNAGYNVKEIVSREHALDEDMRKLKVAQAKMWMAWGLTFPIMFIMIPEMLFGMMVLPEKILGFVYLVLAFPVVFYVGFETLKSAFISVKNKNANMDVLITLGTVTAYVTGIAALLMPVANYAAISAMIMSFHLTGRYVETKARGRASQAIKKLLELGAKTARVVRKGKELSIPIEEVVLGDILIIKPGEKIPTDGLVIQGESAVDESMATGESIPVAKKKGSAVIGATINQRGLLRVKATKIGKDTFLSQVIKMVQEAQGTKVPIQVFADKVTSIFVPVVLMLAVLTFVLWMAFPKSLTSVGLWFALPWLNQSLNTFSLAVLATVSVLVIACPCALGLATPTALMVGSGKGAEQGILIRNGAAIQLIKQARYIVFDKTGTITKGKPEVTDMIPVHGFSERNLLLFAASVEHASEHPLADAIAAHAKKQRLKLLQLKQFEVISGKGVRALIQNKRVLIGNRKLMHEFKVDFDSVEQDVERLEHEAKTVMLVSIDRKMAGVIAVADTLKDDSADAIQELNKLGFETVMITGDNKRTAQAIAEKVGITRIVSEVLPNGKVDEIKKLQKDGVVVMVGDGINDAPALTQADVGIAIGTGTDIAIESSDITIVRGELSAVISAIKLSQATFRKIKQNLFWAFFYNVVAIPVAIMGLLHPVIAEAAMAFSSVTVVTNANLLRRVNIKPDFFQNGA